MLRISPERSRGMDILLHLSPCSYLSSMSRWHSYINSAVTILDAYKGEEPLAAFLKKFFAQHKKYGSGDRKQVSHLCYSYFRLGKALQHLSVEDRIIAGLFLTSTGQHPVLELRKPEWNEQLTLPVEEKLKLIDATADIRDVFPWKDELSEGIDPVKLGTSFFIQPDLFLRLRPGKERIVKSKLDKAGIAYTEIDEFCIAIANASKVDEWIQLNEEAVVQDFSSQQTGTLLKELNPKSQLWDCCAASGGKSIMAWDLLPGIALTVSDKRESILSNLRRRFREAGINNYRSLVVDLADEKATPLIADLHPSIIIADVPCTGSGTWSRTPEQLFYFEEKQVDEYASLQKKIMHNVVPQLQVGGYLLYITCSVFKKENEGMIDFLQKFSLQLIEKKVLKGYSMKADTMFAALLALP